MTKETEDKNKLIEPQDLKDILWHLDYAYRSMKIYGKEPIDVDFWLGHVKKAAMLMEKYQGGKE